MTDNFKIGVYKFHEEPNFDFQLNRLLIWHRGKESEIEEAAKKIHTVRDWVVEFTNLGDLALKERRLPEAIAYYRSAAFFEVERKENKLMLYRKTRSLFNQYYERLIFENIERTYVPFKSAKLPVWIAKPSTKSRDTILLHGGNDSTIEEFLPIILYLKRNGFTVYLFEGPGQGEVLIEQNVFLTYRWEKPVMAILDHFGLKNVTIIGASIGAILATRAAAFDKRIKRVVAWSIMSDFLDVLLSTRPQLLNFTLRGLLKLKAITFVNWIAKGQMKKDPLAQWGLKHGMNNMGVNTPYHYFTEAKQFQITDVAKLINQDFLLLGAQQDHFIPTRMYKEQIDLLENARSITYRLFTSAENAQNHCNIGNTKLVLDTICNWIDLMKKRQI